MSTPKQLFENDIASHLAENADKVAEINAAYQFDLSGDNGGTWHILLGERAPDGMPAVGEGEVEGGAQCTISMSDENFVNLLGGNLNPTMAFMSGKIRVTGDMGLALKLQSVLGA